MLSTFATTVRSVVDLEVDPEKARFATDQWETERKPLISELAAYERGLEPQFSAWLAQPAKLPQTSWQVLTASELQSQAGTTFQRLPDGSYLAQGKNGDHDTYTFTASIPLRGITGLEARGARGRFNDQGWSRASRQRELRA
jgi:hypothetical protein